MNINSTNKEIIEELIGESKINSIYHYTLLQVHLDISISSISKINDDTYAICGRKYLKEKIEAPFVSIVLNKDAMKFLLGI